MKGESRCVALSTNSPFLRSQEVCRRSKGSSGRTRVERVAPAASQRADAESSSLLRSWGFGLSEAAHVASDPHDAHVCKQPLPQGGPSCRGGLSPGPAPPGSLPGAVFILPSPCMTSLPSLGSSRGLSNDRCQNHGSCPCLSQNRTSTRGEVSVAFLKLFLFIFVAAGLLFIICP